MCTTPAQRNIVDNGWTEADYYDHRKKYMLDRVEEASNDRTLSKKMGSSSDEFKMKQDASTLRDDRPKRGQAVTLLRTSDELTDSDIATIGQQALLGQVDKSEKVYKDKYFGNVASSLQGANAALGRSNTTAPNVTKSQTPYTNELGITSYQTTETPDWNISDAEKASMKQAGRKSVLDRFYGVDTSKY